MDALCPRVAFYVAPKPGYSADTWKIVCVSSAVIEEIKRIVKQSEIIKEDDSKWPQKNKDGRQELEIRLGGDHISFEVCL